MKSNNFSSNLIFHHGPRPRCLPSPDWSQYFGGAQALNMIDREDVFGYIGLSLGIIVGTTNNFVGGLLSSLLVTPMCTPYWTVPSPLKRKRKSSILILGQTGHERRLTEMPFKRHTQIRLTGTSTSLGVQPTRRRSYNCVSRLLFDFWDGQTRYGVSVLRVTRIHNKLVPESEEKEKKFRFFYPKNFGQPILFGPITSIYTVWYALIGTLLISN